MTLADAVSWAISHKAQLAQDYGDLVAGASFVVLGAAKMADVLVQWFPKLKGVDGKLHWTIGALAKAAKWGPINALALNPSPAIAKAATMPVLVPKPQEATKP